MGSSPSPHVFFLGLGLRNESLIKIIIPNRNNLDEKSCLT
jgi:hypothetical protein